MPLWKEICAAFDAITSESPCYMNVWLCNETITNAIANSYPDIKKIRTFKRWTVNGAIKKKYGDTRPKWSFVFFDTTKSTAMDEAECRVVFVGVGGGKRGQRRKCSSMGSF